jgi:hypothetical protein
MRTIGDSMQNEDLEASLVSLHSLNLLCLLCHRYLALPIFCNNCIVLTLIYIIQRAWEAEMRDRGDLVQPPPPPPP